MTIKWTLLGIATLAAAACATRSPTLPTVTEEDKSAVREAEPWRDIGPNADPEAARKAREAAIPGTRLNSDAINRAFRGRNLRGCYPNGEGFAERLAEDGRFYDLNGNNTLLGTWSVNNAQLCFDYSGSDAPASCFVVVKNGNVYDFYAPDLSRKVASTGCAG